VTPMRALIGCFILLSGGCFAQVAGVDQVVLAGGFLDVCGHAGQFSKAQGETVKNTPPSQLTDTLNKVMADHAADNSLCLGYVAGLIEGWKEDHEHGVAAAQFPDGWPKDEKKALATLPLKQLQAATAAMSVDVPCIPDYVTIGQERDIIVKYMRNSEKQGNFFLAADLTSHMMWLAFEEAFPCPAKPPDTAK
jgi:hypothetical protein